MPRARGHISTETLLAAELLRRRDADGNPWVPYEHARLMTAAQVISLFERQHTTQHAIGGADDHCNVEMMPIMQHRRMTATVDRPAVEKVKNNATNTAIHRAKLASKAGDYAGAAQILARAPKPGRLKPRRPIPSRPFPKDHRPLRSRSAFLPRQQEKS